MKISFIKIAQYGSAVPITRKYTFYAQATKQVSDPDIDLPISYHPRYQRGQYMTVFSSPLRRGLSSASYLAQHVVALDQLREVRFDLTQLVTKQEYMLYGSNLVRGRFVKAFIADTLLEKRQMIIGRVRKLLLYLYSLHTNEIVCVSHSFFMKIIEAHTKGCDLLQYPEKIADFIQPNTKTYPFGEGFVYTLQ